jgi:polyisoprenoid-binding protein YceI
MMIATVLGRFKEFEGTIEAAEEIDDSRVYGIVKTASIDTNEPTRAGIRVRGTIDRKEFGLTWQKVLESGGFLVGEEVKILVDVSAVRAS